MSREEQMMKAGILGGVVGSIWVVLILTLTCCQNLSGTPPF